MKGLLSAIHRAFHEPRTRLYRVVQGTVWSLILLSILFLIVEGLVPEGSPAIEWLRNVDRVVLAIFAIEIVLRVGSFRSPALELFKRPPIRSLRVHILSRIAYALRPVMLVDILAVLALFPELRGLRALRLLRLMRTSRVFRYRNPFAIIVQTLEENGLLFAFAFSVLVVTTSLGGVSIYLIEGRVNPEINNLLDGVWWALVTITTVGFGDITPLTLLGRIVGAVMMIGGMFTLALFAGIVGSSLVAGMLSIREEQFRMSNYVNHVIVCGYDPNRTLLLNAIARELDLNETRVVIFDENERPRDLPPEFLWVQGDPAKESELDKVRLTHAAAIIVSGSRDTSPQVADAQTILIVFTIRSYLQAHKASVDQRRFPVYIVAEILDSENVDHARTAGADEVIETRKIGFSMIAHAVRHHGTATTMTHVLVSGSHNVYIGRVPKPNDEPMPLADLLRRMKLGEQGGLVIGIRTPAGQEILNPPRTHIVEPGTQLIYLAENPLLEAPG